MLVHVVMYFSLRTAGTESVCVLRVQGGAGKVGGSASKKGAQWASEYFRLGVPVPSRVRCNWCVTRLGEGMSHKPIPKAGWKEPALGNSGLCIGDLEAKDNVKSMGTIFFPPRHQGHPLLLSKVGVAVKIVKDALTCKRRRIFDDHGMCFFNA